MGPHNPTTQNLVGRGIKQQFRKSLITAIGDRAPRSRPGKHALGDGDAFLFGLILRQSYPRDLRIGIGHRRNHTCIKITLLTRCSLSGDMALVHSFVRKHRLANNIANRENVGHVGPHLSINLDETAVGDHDTRTVGRNLFTIGCPTNGLQHQVIALRLFRGALAFKRHINAVFFSDGTDGFRLEHQVVKTMAVHFLPDFDEIAVRALHQTVLHLNDIEA